MRINIMIIAVLMMNSVVAAIPPSIDLSEVSNLADATRKFYKATNNTEIFTISRYIHPGFYDNDDKGKQFPLELIPVLGKTIIIQSAIPFVASDGSGYILSGLAYAPKQEGGVDEYSSFIHIWIQSESGWRYIPKAYIKFRSVELTFEYGINNLTQRNYLTVIDREFKFIPPAILEKIRLYLLDGK